MRRPDVKPKPKLNPQERKHMRTTKSRKPVSAPAVADKDYLRVEATRINLTTNDGKTRLQVRFEASDGTDIIYGHGYRLDIADTNAEEVDIPRLTETLNRLHNILGRYYTLRSIKQEIQDLDTLNEDDPSPTYEAEREALVLERIAARQALRAPAS